MFSLLKWLFFLSVVFVGLYFFGDFRVNDVHVRDTLQAYFSPQALQKKADKAKRFYQAIKRVYDDFEKQDTPIADAVIQAEENIEDTKKALEKATKQLDSKAFDQLSSRDQKKLHEFFQQQTQSNP